MERDAIERDIEERVRARVGRPYLIRAGIGGEPDDDGWQHVGFALYIGKSKKFNTDWRITWHPDSDEIRIERHK